MAYLVFDADGVLIDSRRRAWDVAAAIRSMFDGPHSIDSAVEAEALFNARAQEALVGAHAATLRMIHRLVMMHHASALNRFEQVLKAIKEVPARRMVVTSALAEGISVALQGDLALFDQVIGFESGRKPDLLAQLVARGEPFLYVTDSASDVRICNALNVQCLAVTWGYDPRARLEQVKPLAIIDTPVQLKKLLQSFLVSHTK